MRILIGIVVLVIVAAWAMSALAWNFNPAKPAETTIEGVTEGEARCYSVHDELYGDGYVCNLLKYENTTNQPQTFTYPEAFEAPACLFMNSLPMARTTEAQLLLPTNMAAPFVGNIVVFACRPPYMNRKW